MRCARRKQGRWAGLGLSLVLGLGVAWPAGAADGEEALAAEPDAVEDNDRVGFSQIGVTSVEVRLREIGVRTYENLHPIDRWTDQVGLPTRGMSSRPVDIIYHRPRSYGEPSGIVTRRIATFSPDDRIPTHRVSDSVDGSPIRYHGGFR